MSRNWESFAERAEGQDLHNMIHFGEFIKNTHDGSLSFFNIHLKPFTSYTHKSLFWNNIQAKCIRTEDN